MSTEPSSKTSTAAVTIRGLSPELKTRLRIRAAHNARSMEAEARAILETALSVPDEDATDLAAFARGLFAPLGGIEIELPAREPARDPPDFASRQAAAAEPAASEPISRHAVAPRRSARSPGPKAPARRSTPRNGRA